MSDAALLGSLLADMVWNKEDVPDDSLAAHDYTPYGAARKAYESEEPEILLSGPAGTGKSRASLEKLNYLAWRYPGMRALIVRKTRVSLSESGLVTYEMDVMGEDNPIIQGAGRHNRKVYKYPNGSQIVIGGMDKATRIMSTEYDIIFVQEAIELTRDDWEALTTRLRHGVVPYQQMIGDTNPDSEYHWLYRRCDDGATLMLYCSHEDNPRLYSHDTGEWSEDGLRYLSKLDALTGVRFDRLRWGKWAQAEGAVYDEFTPALHIVDRFEIPRHWRRMRSIDFGYKNPFVCQWWAISPDGDMYLYRELYMSKRIVEDHAREINRWSTGEKIEVTVADHDAEDRATLARYGISTRAAYKDIAMGIQAVQARLRCDEVTGKPSIFFMRDSLVELDNDLQMAALPTHTVAEFPGYVWPVTIEGKTAKEVPVDKDNHGMDCTRYMVVHVDGKPVGPVVQTMKHNLYGRKNREKRRKRRR